MSWLYSILITGLMFASGDDVAENRHKSLSPEEIPAAASRAQDVTEKFDQTYPLPADGRVSVTNINGSIVVEAWDRNEVRVEATKIADSQETLNEVQIKVNTRVDAIRVEADWGSWKFRDGSDSNRNQRIEVQFKISAPRGAVLNSIETINGSVTLAEFTNLTKASAVNGNVNAGNLRGAASLSTVNGEVKAEFDRVDQGSKISLHTVNGAVRLVLPSDVNATLKADSLNGDITNEFGLPVRKGQFIGRNLYGRLGSGDVQIKLNSVNGPLSISRRKDGRQQSPATNLLSPGKDSDDLDVDVELEMDEAFEAVNDVRISEKEVAAAMKTANAEIARVKPELDKVKVKVDTEAMNAKIAANQAKIAENIARRAETFNRMAEIGWGGRAPSMRKVSNTIKVGEKPAVNINANGCNVSVRSWDRPEVRYVLTELGTGRKPVVIKDDVSPGVVNLSTSNSSDEPFTSLLNGEPNVRLEVMVPATSDVKVVTDGSIRINGVSGNIVLEGEDAPIDIRDISGRLNLKAVDAQVRVIGFKGEVESNTEDGDIFLEGAFSKVNAQALNGTITLTVPTDANADIDSNTEVKADGVNVVRNGARGVRVGSGGQTYKFTFGEGHLVLRSPNSLETF